MRLTKKLSSKSPTFLLTDANASVALATALAATFYEDQNTCLKPLSRSPALLNPKPLLQGPLIQETSRSYNPMAKILGEGKLCTAG